MAGTGPAGPGGELRRLRKVNSWRAGDEESGVAAGDRLRSFQPTEIAAYRRRQLESRRPLCSRPLGERRLPQQLTSPGLARNGVLCAHTVHKSATAGCRRP
jgi:hypothetical protein